MPFYGGWKMPTVPFVKPPVAQEHAKPDTLRSTHAAGPLDEVQNTFKREPDSRGGAAPDVPAKLPDCSAPKLPTETPTPTVALPPLQGAANAVEGSPVLPSPSPGAAPTSPPEPMSTEREKILDGDIRSKLVDDQEGLQKYEELQKDKTFREHSEEAVESRIAVLEQVRNHPEGPVVEALGKLTQKEWYRSQSFDDKQRTSKMIAYNASGEVRKANEIRQNSVDYLLGKDDLQFNWVGNPNCVSSLPFGGLSISDIPFVPKHDPRIILLRPLVPAGDLPLESSENPTLEAYPEAEHTAIDLFAHEVNHSIRNGYPFPTYDFYMNEYRAKYVGYMALEHEEPSREYMLKETQDIIENYIPIKLVLDGPAFNPERKKIIAHIAKIAGLDPETTTIEDIRAMEIKDLEKPKAPALKPEPSGARGDINDLNNDGRSD